MCGCECRGGSQVGRVSGSDPRLTQLWQQPTRAERKETLEAFRKRLEDWLAEVKEDLAKL